MSLRRYLRPEAIRLELRTRARPEDETAEDFDAEAERNLDRIREEVLEELAELLGATGEISSASRLHRDLLFREKRTGTAIGSGVAIPHVRTLQTRQFLMCLGRSQEGLPFRAPDGQPVHLFFGMVAPPYDDRTYLKAYRELALLLQDPERHQEFLSAREPSEVLRILETLR